MDDSIRAMHALKRQKEEKRRKTQAKEIVDRMISGAVSILNKAKEKNGGRLPHNKMINIIQGLQDNGVHTSRSILNKLLKTYYVKAVITVTKETRAPLSIIDVNMEQVFNISSLCGVKGGRLTMFVRHLAQKGWASERQYKGQC